MNRNYRMMALALLLVACAPCVVPTLAQRKPHESQDTIQSIRGKPAKRKKPIARPKVTPRYHPARSAVRRVGGTVVRARAVKREAAAAKPLRLVVAQAGNSRFRTIGEAVQAAPAGAQILVRGGTYRESLVIDKPIELIPASPEEVVVLENTTRPALYLRAPRATVRDFAIQIVGPEAERANTAVDISAGKPILERCEVIGGRNACVAVHGQAADPILRQCVVHRGIGEGIQFFDKSRGSVEGGEAYGNGANGIDIDGGANVRVHRTKLHDNRRAGLLMDNWSGGELDNVEAFGNAWVGIAIRHASKATIRYCRIYSNAVIGLWIVEKSEVQAGSCDVHDNLASGIELVGVADTVVKACNSYANKEHGIHTWDAKVTLEACESSDNAKTGIYLQGETPIARACKVHDNHGPGIHITDGGIANVEDCEVFANAGIGVLVDSGARPTIKACRLHDNKIDGATVVDAPTAGAFVDCDVYANAESGIGILGGTPNVRSCRLINNKNGLVVGGVGRATAEGCTATDNAVMGFAVIPGGSLTAQRCTARGNKTSGILVENDAFGSFEQCDVYDNGPPNATIRPRGKANFLGCRIP